MTEVASDRLIRARLFLGALKARRAAAVMLFVVAVLAIAAAAIGPMFLQSADTSVLTSTANAAVPGQADLVVISNGGSLQMSKLKSATEQADHLGDGLLSRTIFTVDAGSHFTVNMANFGADLLARSDICAHLSFVDGVCPTKTNDVAMSERSADAAGLHVGSHLRVKGANSPTTFDMTVTAIYRQPPTVDDNYWKDNFYFIYGTGEGPSLQLDPLITSFKTVLATNRATRPQLLADLAWRPGAMLSGAPALKSTVATIKSVLFSHDGLEVTTGLQSVVNAAHHDDDLMSAVVLALVLQLILLSLLILYTLGRSTILGRRQESEFARRHGFPRASMVTLAIGEPGALIVAALPVGLLVAWVTLVVLARTLFVSGTPVSLSLVAVACAVGACLAGVLALAVASSELWRSQAANNRQVKLIGLAVDAFALALALTGLLSLATKGSVSGVQANPLASLAPGLLALGAGVIGLRLAALVVKAIIRRSGESSHVASFLALRQVGRRPSVLRQVLPLTAATVVLLFAVGSFFLASSNRSLVANVDVGAARVVDVTPPPGLNFEAAVRRADPSGREAMAAAYYSSSTGALLAVDSSRLAAVATWPKPLSRKPVAHLAQELSPPVPPGVSFSGNELRLSLNVQEGSPPMELAVTVFDETYQNSEVLDVARVVAGPHTYDLLLAGECPGTCRLINMSPIWLNPYATYKKGVRIELSGIATRTGAKWRDVPFGAGKKGTWDVVPAPAHVESTQGTCCEVFDFPGRTLAYGGVLLSPVDLPTALPAIVTKAAETYNPPSPPLGLLSVVGLDGGALTVRPVAVVPTLPLIGQGGTLVDLALAQRAIASPESNTTFQVWLSPSANATDILKRLRQDGITIGPSVLASTNLGVLDHSGIALAYAIALLVSPIAALLAIGTMIFVIVSDGRRRRSEITSLSRAGVPTRIVRRALLYENAVVLGIALVVGAIVGFVADSLALTSLPEFATGTGGVPISTAVPITPFVGAVGILALLLAGAVELATRSILYGTRAGRDGGAQ